MNETMSGGIGLVIMIFLFILAILWFLLPFAIFGTKDKLSELIQESKKTNSNLTTLINEIQKLNTSPNTENIEPSKNEGNNSSDEELMEKYNIKFINDKYTYKEFNYDTLKDAINYVKKQGNT